MNNQNFHPVPAKIMKISATVMKFQGASIGKGPGAQNKLKIDFLIFGPGAPDPKTRRRGPLKAPTAGNLRQHVPWRWPRAEQKQVP